MRAAVRSVAPHDLLRRRNGPANRGDVNPRRRRRIVACTLRRCARGEQTVPGNGARSSRTAACAAPARGAAGGRGVIRLVSEFETEEQAKSHKRWFRAKVRDAMNSAKPRLPHDEAMARVDSLLSLRKDRPVPAVRWSDEAAGDLADIVGLSFVRIRGPAPPRSAGFLARGSPRLGGSRSGRERADKPRAPDIRSGEAAETGGVRRRRAAPPPPPLRGPPPPRVGGGGFIRWWPQAAAFSRRAPGDGRHPCRRVRRQPRLLAQRPAAGQPMGRPAQAPPQRERIERARPAEALAD